jgi:thiamine kinase-like enzyme
VGELDDILQSLQAALGPLNGTPVALEGGITNRNYRVTLGAGDYVVRRPGKDTELLGIDRETERVATDAAAALGIAPPVAAVVEGCLVTRFIGCRAMGEGEVAERVEEIAHGLRAFHGSEVRLSSSFWVLDLLTDYASIVSARGGTLPGEYEEVQLGASRIVAALPPARPCPCHNDLLPGNIISASEGGGILLVDWEYAGMGDPRFDLGNLSVNNGFGDADDERLLSAYHGRPPSESQRAALKLMRILSDAREAAWGVVQAVVSELDFDFTGYAREHFGRLLETIAHPEFEEWLIVAQA